MFCQAGECADYVDETYADGYFDSGGGGYSDYLRQEETLIKAGNKYAKLLEPYVGAGRLLDIGAAAGFILTGFEQCGWNGVGVEPNPSMAELARRRGCDVLNSTIEALPDQEPFDAIILVQVISHLRDPLAVLNRAHDLLKPGGVLLIETWNRKSLTARVFGRYWHQANPPSVLHWFTKPHLQMMLERCGFTVVQRGRPIKLISVGNGVSLILHSVRESALGRLVTTPLAVVPKSLKAPYFLDDVFWFVAQKQSET